MVVVAAGAAAAAAVVAAVVVFVLPATAPAAAALPPAAAAPCETSTQLPKPALVVNETRHWFPLAPPVHVVPAGSVPETCTVPVVAGFGSPFFVIVTFPAKFLPVAAVSTVADLMAVAPSVPLNEN